jgi:hypothetical protein
VVSGGDLHVCEGREGEEASALASAEIERRHELKCGDGAEMSS